jgi:hypothetical protein
MRLNKQRGFLNFPDLRPLFYLALVGLIAIGAGLAALVWFIAKHLHWASP